MIDITKARENINRKYDKKAARCLELFNEATRDCRSILLLIQQKYSPTKIYQWGSLLDSRRFNEHSDIDLAIEGITSAETFFNLLGDAMKLTKFPLDIIQMEKIEPEFAQGIRENGVVLYERT